MCQKLKKNMNENLELTNMVNEVKSLQQKYVKSNYDENIGTQLKELESKLSDIPIYVIYNQYLEKVNNMINLVNDELNDYFYKLLNESK